MKAVEDISKLPMDQLMTVGDASQRSGFDRQTIHKWIRDGLVRGTQITGLGVWMVVLADVDKVAVASRERKPGRGNPLVAAMEQEDGQ